MTDAEKLRRCLEEGDRDDHIAPLLMDEVERLRAAAAEDRARIAGLVAAIRGYRDCHDRLKWDGRCSCDECRAAALVLAEEDKSC